MIAPGQRVRVILTESPTTAKDSKGSATRTDAVKREVWAYVQRNSMAEITRSGGREAVGDYSVVLHWRDAIMMESISPVTGDGRKYNPLGSQTGKVVSRLGGRRGSRQIRLGVMTQRG